MQEKEFLLEVLERKTKYEDPFRFQTLEDFKDLILETLAHGASDIMIQPGFPVCIEVQGRMFAVTHRNLDDGEVSVMLVFASGRDTAQTDISRGEAVNVQYELFDPEKKDYRGERIRYRYRVNASPIGYHGHSSCQIVMRSIPQDPPLYNKLGLDESLVRKMCPEDGIVYVAGRTGSGKTTTFASIIRFILENDTPITGNLITHEEPVEFLYGNIKSKHSIIVQSQIPVHFNDFQAANREAMRRKPGLILVGEMRDQDTISAAIEASLTGHPVFGTVHAVNVAAIFRRLISRFPEVERATAIYDIIDSARFAMAQTLVMGKDGKRVAAREWLEFDGETRQALAEITDMGRVTSVVHELLQTKGWTFEKEAQSLHAQGLIDDDVAEMLKKRGI